MRPAIDLLSDIGDEIHAPIRTTLYDLIDAINNEIAPGEEHLVVATVVHLLRTGRITYPAGLAQMN